MIGALAQTPYSERRQQMAMQIVPRLAIGGADLYVSTLNAVGVGSLQAMAPSGPIGQHLAATAGALAGAMPFISGAAAVGHAISGITVFASESPYTEGSTADKGRKVKGLGEFITAAGFVGQAVGFGPWALPVSLIGLATTLIGTVVEARGGTP